MVKFLMKYILIAVLLVTGIVRADDIQLPIGIPDPKFGILEEMPQRPNSWSKEVRGYYYINSGEGTDDGRTYGSPAAPRKTIPKELSPGSYVEVDGTYDYTVRGATEILGYGTPGDWKAGESGPVWITSSAAKTNVGFVKKTIVRGAHIYLVGLKVQDKGQLQIGSKNGAGATNIMVKDCIIQGDGWSRQNGLTVTCSPTNFVSNVLLIGNSIYNWGNMSTNVDQDSTPLVVASGENVWALNNRLFNSSGPGVRVGGAYSYVPPDNCRNIFFGSNIVHHTRQAGLAIKYAQGIVFSQNDLADMVETPWSPSKGIGAQYAPVDVWFLYNNIRGTRYGVRIGATDTGVECPIYIIGNVISNIRHNPESGTYKGGSWDEAGIMLQGGTSRYIINNTIVDCDAGINMPGGGEFFIENNIIARVLEEKGNHIYSERGSATCVIRNNLFYQEPPGKEKIKLGSDIRSLAYLLSFTGKGTGSLMEDPQLYQADGGGIVIANTSPAKGAGLDHAELSLDVYNKYYATFGVDINVDFYGNPRPENPSMGAVEPLGTSRPTTGTPRPPQRLRIIQ